MRAEIRVRVGSSEHTLAMPLGALEDVAAVNPYLFEVYGALQGGVWKLDELNAVLAAGIKHGGADLTVEKIIEEHGLQQRAESGLLTGGAVKIAADLLAAAFKDDQPKKAPAAARKKKSVSASH